MKRIFILIGIVLLSGCATIPSPIVLKSEKLGIPKAYYINLDEFKSKNVYHFEYIVNSEPKEAEVWRTENDKAVELIGKTPLAIQCYIFFRRENNSLVLGSSKEFQEYSVFPKEVFFYEYNATGLVNKIIFGNIIIKKADYDDYIVKERAPSLYHGVQLSLAFIVKGMENRGKSIEISCPLIINSEKFDAEYKELIEQKKIKEAEELKQQRIVKLKQAVELEGLRDDYVKELKRLKTMGNLTEAEKAKPKEDLSKDIAKLKEDLDNAIKAGDYDKASKIKELIEYKEKNKPDESLKGINEGAIKHNKEGLAYARQKYYDDASKSFKKAIEADPIYVDPYLNLSFCYIYLGNAQEAINYAEKALKLKLDSPLAFYYMGLAYDVLGNHPLAVEKYQKALAECAIGECSDDFIVQIKKEGIEGGFFNSLQAAKAQSSKSSSSQGFDFGDLLLGALLVGSSANSGK